MVAGTLSRGGQVLSGTVNENEIKLGCLLADILRTKVGSTGAPETGGVS